MAGGAKGMVGWAVREYSLRVNRGMCESMKKYVPDACDEVSMALLVLLLLLLLLLLGVDESGSG